MHAGFSPTEPPAQLNSFVRCATAATATTGRVPASIVSPSKHPLILAEPPAAYLHRPRLVVDASVMAAAVFSEANQQQAIALMNGRTICAPHLLDYEIANAALNKVRRRLASSETASEALEKFAALDFERFAINSIAVFQLAMNYKLSAYDASYLWLASELRTPLTTFDEKLGAAATKHLGTLGGS